MTLPITARDITSSATTGESSQSIVTGIPTAGSVAQITLNPDELSATNIRIAGTYTGTLVFEGTPDGLAWAKIDVLVQGINTTIQSTTSIGLFTVACAGLAGLRVRSTAAFTGEADIAFTTSTRADLQHMLLMNAAALTVTLGNVGGLAAAGGSPSGNPLLIAGSDGSAVRNILTDATGRLLTDRNVDTAALLTFTGAGAETVHSADQTNYSGKGANVVIDLTTATLATVVVTIEGKDIASGKYYTILSSSTLAAAGTTVLSVYPGLAVTANVSANAILPKTWRISATVAGAGPILTGTVGASVIE